MTHRPARAPFQSVALLALLPVGCPRAAATPRPPPPQATVLRPPAPAAPTPPPAQPAPVVARRPPWPRTLPAASVMGDGQGRWLRVVVHAHSVQSSDACDGRPYVDGAPNEPCLQSFRGAACATKLDVVFLTEHADRLASVRFEESMPLREGDEPLREDGALVGYRIRCADGHRVMVLPGAENDLMPLGLARWDPLESTCRHASLSIL